VLAALTMGGLAAATRSLAVEYASRGIRVNRRLARQSSRPRCTRRTATRDSVTSFRRSGASAMVSYVVDGILFLESSPYITGEIMHVDGGQTAGR